MDFLQKLDFLMEKYGLNKLTLSQNSGIPYSTVVGWYKKGYEGLKLTTLRKLSDYFNTVLDYWINDEIDPNYWKSDGFIVNSEEMGHIQKYRLIDREWQEAVDSVLEIGYKRYEADLQARATAIRRAKQETEAAEIEPAERKVIDMSHTWLKASAGSGYQLDEGMADTWIVELNDLTRKADFCVDVEGRSMEPKFYDGDIILIRQQPAVDIGEIGLFTVNDKGYVKKQGADRLISINDEFEDIIPSEYDTVFCRGKVIGILDPEWIVER